MMDNVSFKSFWEGNKFMYREDFKSSPADGAKETFLKRSNLNIFWSRILAFEKLTNLRLLTKIPLNKFRYEIKIQNVHTESLHPGTTLTVLVFFQSPSELELESWKVPLIAPYRQENGEPHSCVGPRSLRPELKPVS